MQIRCPKCGQIQSAANFCNNCGIKFAPIEVKKKSSKTTVISLIIAGIFVVLIFNAVVKEPSKPQPAQQITSESIDPDEKIIGKKPMQSGFNGDVLPVKQYLGENLNDYDSSEFVEWSPVSKVEYMGQKFWGVRLRLRAKNAFGAYIMRDTYYYIRNDKVVFATGLSGDE